MQGQQFPHQVHKTPVHWAGAEINSSFQTSYQDPEKHLPWEKMKHTGGIMSTVNLSNIPTMAGSLSPTLEAVVVAVLLLPGQGTHSRKDHVQQQAGLQEHSGSGSGQARDFQGEKTLP